MSLHPYARKREGENMIYQKNVPGWERAMRVGLGLLLVVAAAESIYSGRPMVLSVGLLFSAIGIVATGFLGWCPACAMVGRKLKFKE
ncbi:MAG TPA: DUF2892 domain-containing protein [Leptospiraceae bacterium]|nr:DUF2892 domain-containing protein [Leptospiraceae bacterium]